MARLAIIEPEPVLLPDDELVAKMFRTLGHPARLRIIELLLDRPRFQKELVDGLGLAQSQIAQHLACLTWCGFVASERRGRTVEYSIVNPRVVALVDMAHAFLRVNEAEIAACRRVDDGTGNHDE